MPNLDPKPDAADFSERLNKALEHNGFPKRGRGAELMRRYKVSNATASAWLNGGHMPKPQTVRDMAGDYGVSYDWLYFGEGDPEYSAKREEPTVEIPLWDAEGSTGYGALNEHARVIGTLTFKRASLERKGVNIDRSDAFYIRGISMLPRLRDGDAVVFDQADIEPQEGKMYMVRWTGHEYVKRLRFFDGRWHLCSDNQNDPEWKDPRPIYEGDDFEVRGRVRWIGSWED